MQEVAVARRALRVELEVLDAPVLQNDEFDILSTHVADDVRFRVEVKGRLRVRHRLDDSHIGAQHVTQNILGITGRAYAQQLERSALRFDLLAQVGEHFLGVFERVALGELVALHHDFAVFAQQDGLGRGRPPVDAHEGPHLFARLESARDEFLGLVALFERVQLVVCPVETCRTFFLFLFEATNVDVPVELVPAFIDAHVRVLIHAKADTANGGEVLGVLGNLHKLLGVLTFRQGEIPLFPNPGNVVFPAIAHPLDVSVGAAQKQHHGAQRVAAGEHGEILLDDRLEERSHQLVGRDAALLQAVDVRFGEDAALPCHGMELQPQVTHVAELLGRDAQLGVDLVDDCACTPCTLVIHGGVFLLPAGLWIFLEDNDFRVLSTKLDHRAALGIEMLDGERDGVHFLDELGTDQGRDAAATAAGEEHACFPGTDSGFDFHSVKEFQALLGLFGVVALVVAPDNLLGGSFHDNTLHCCRADIQSDHQVFRTRHACLPVGGFS